MVTWGNYWQAVDATLSEGFLVIYKTDLPKENSQLNRNSITIPYTATGDQTKRRQGDLSTTDEQLKWDDTANNYRSFTSFRFRYISYSVFYMPDDVNREARRRATPKFEKYHKMEQKRNPKPELLKRGEW